MNNIKKNFSLQITYRIITVLTPLITSPIVTRALGASNLGIYSATLTIVNYFMLFAMLGVENYGTRSIASLQGDHSAIQKQFWNIYAVQLSASMLSILLYSLCFLFIDHSRRIISLFQGIWLISCMLDINWFFFGIEQFKLTVIRNLVVKFIEVLMIVLFIHRPSDLDLYAIIMSASMAISQILIWINLSRYIGFERPRLENMRMHILPILKLFVPLLATNLYQIIGRSMLDWLSDDISLGCYYAADKVINIPRGIITAISMVMLPRMAGMFAEFNPDGAKKLIRSASELVMFLVSAVAFGIGGIAKEFVPVFFGPGYELCITLIYGFVPLLFIRCFNESIRLQYLIPAKRDALCITAVLIGAAVNIIGNLPLIKLLGAMGAVLSMLIAELTVLAIQQNGAREIPFAKYYFSQVRYLLIGAAMFLLLRFLSSILKLDNILKLLLMIASGSFFYILCCLVSWTADDKSIFHPLITKFRHK